MTAFLMHNHRLLLWWFLWLLPALPSCSLRLDCSWQLSSRSSKPSEQLCLLPLIKMHETKALGTVTSQSLKRHMEGIESFPRQASSDLQQTPKL